MRLLLWITIEKHNYSKIFKIFHFKSYITEILRKISSIRSLNSTENEWEIHRNCQWIKSAFLKITPSFHQSNWNWKCIFSWFYIIFNYFQKHSYYIVSISFFFHLFLFKKWMWNWLLFPRSLENILKTKNIFSKYNINNNKITFILSMFKTECGAI